MTIARLIAAVFLAASPLSATADDAPAPDVEAGVGRVYMMFCLPAVLAPAQVEEAAKTAGLTKTDLPKFSALTNRSAQAWSASTKSGHVVASINASTHAGHQNVETCEITVTGAPSEPLRKQMESMAICKGCPFSRNEAFSGERGGVTVDKYDWRPDKDHFISVLTVAMPDDSKGASFFVQVQALQG